MFRRRAATSGLACVAWFTLAGTFGCGRPSDKLGGEARDGATAGGSSAGGAAATGGASCDPPLDATGCVHPPVVARCSNGFCEVPPGCFVMGSPPCEWSRGRANENEMAVTLTHALEVQERELTQAEWTALGLPNPSGSREDVRDCIAPDCPVGQVSFMEALMFANMLSERHNPPLPACYELVGCSGKLGQALSCERATTTSTTVYECQGYRLPTKAEWEYAARAGSRSAFYTGDITPQSDVGVCGSDPVLEQLAWYCHNSGATTHPVAAKRPNAWGLYDVLGNAAEWTTGAAQEALRPSSATDPEGDMRDSPIRPTRGGFASAHSSDCRLADWLVGGLNQRAPGFGLRLVRTLR